MTSSKRTRKKPKQPTTRAGRRERSVKTTEMVATSPNGTGLVKKGVAGWISTYEDETGAKIIDSIREGMPIAAAAHLHCVPQSTVYHWIANGEENPNHELFGPFAAGVRRAQSEFIHEAVTAIKKAGLANTNQWTALMTLLERIYPETFRRPDSGTKVQINNVIGVVEKQLHELHEAGEIEYTGD